MNGSIRQRSAGSWELRAYVGVDPATGRRLDRSITVRGNRCDAERELADMVARIRCVRAVGSRSMNRPADCTGPPSIPGRICYAEVVEVHA